MMQHLYLTHWNNTIQISNMKNIEKFLEELDTLCRVHNISISHEDGQGAFILENYNESNIKWLREAFIEFEEEYEGDAGDLEY